MAPSGEGGFIKITNGVVVVYAQNEWQFHSGKRFFLDVPRGLVKSANRMESTLRTIQCAIPAC